MDVDNEPEILFKWTNSCRLCLSTDCDIDLFSKDPSSQEVLRKIRSCLNLLMYLGDPMPRKLCARCLIKVDDWCQFKEICLQTESNLKKRLENYKKIDFVQDYFDRSAKFLSSEVVSSSRIPATLDDYSSSVISANTEDDNRSCSTNSNQTCGSSGHCESARIRISKDLYPSSNADYHSNRGPSLPNTKDCGTQCRREPENQFRKNFEVGKIANITGSALGLWDDEGEVEEVSDSALEEVIHHEIIIKQEICTTTCPDCGIDFPSDEDYAFHTCSALEASMQCDETDYYTNYTTEILNQRKIHITPWKCEACCEYYQTRTDLNEHYSGTCRGGLFDCQFCDRKFVSESELYQHESVHMRININLTEDDLYCCRKCPLRFCTEKLFNEHFKKIHMTNEINYKCDICEKEYVKKYLYDLHVAKHNESKTQKKIDREKQNELQKGQVRCARCGKLFLDEQELEKHKSEKHKNPTPFRCRLCNTRFSARSQLLLHIRTHRGKRKKVAAKPVTAKPVKVEENEILKSCTMCNAKFSQETDLQSHMLMHSKPAEEPIQPKLEKPEIKEKNLLARYKCSLCAKVFVRSNSVPKHIRLHHKGQHGVIQKLLRPVWVNRFSNLPLPFKKSKFQCTLCPKFFYSKDKLSKHFQKGHSIKQEILEETIMETIPIKENELTAPTTQSEALPDPPMQRKPNSNEAVCKICNNIYSKKYLSYHMKKQHVEKPVVLTPIKDPSPKPVVIKSEPKPPEPKPPEPKIVKRSYKCCHCLRTLFNEWSLRKHENACLKHLKKKCNVCGIRLRAQNTEKHLANCKSVRCRKCNKIFFKYITYLTHGCSQVRGDRIYKCTECLNDYPSEEMLNVHVRKFHSGEEEPMQQEPESILEPQVEIKQENNITVVKELSMEESNKIVCKVDDKFYCTYCDVFFSTDDECTNHESEHPRGNFYAVQIKDNSFQCTVCDVMFESRSNCLVHINYHKKDFRGDTVMDCQGKEADLNSSNESQKEQKSFQCSLCPSAFTTERSYNIHNFYVHSSEMKGEIQ